MARRIPEHRLDDLLEAAVEVFIAHGYRRTQMADVAEAMGLAKGTLYLYVKSKEALFVAALRHASGDPPDPAGAGLPLPAPEPGAIERELEQRLSREAIPPALRDAVERKRVTDARGELERIVRELYDISTRNRAAIKLIDRCTRDHPELARVFYLGGRLAQLDHLSRYLEARVRRGHLRAVADVGLAARFIIETIATWAVHIHWDPAPQPIHAKDAEDMAVRFLLAGLAKE